ncbi:hypothetical protein CC78DRAFT_533257 [Lojkania enalia]|uniref:Uncharacterized protein n=1 Tax=Lojkania enalia TaxID=147567 RepID=A0A9P4K9P3_9PLEO|nr:hypothetical protein CC78DRAFT_533257 [Didymosphaeria enalia]
MVRPAPASHLPIFHPTESPSPPTPPESVKDFRSNSISVSIDDDDSTLRHYPGSVTRSSTCRSCIESTSSRFFHWLLNALGFASAIVLGVWAPLSYRLQESGNRSNDEAQARLTEKVDRLAEEVEKLDRRMDLQGALKAWEFCAGEVGKKLPACESLSLTLRINDVIEDLAIMRPKHAPSSRRTPTPPAPTSSPSPTSVPRSQPTMETRTSGDGPQLMHSTIRADQSLQLSSVLPINTTPAVPGPVIPLPQGLENADLLRMAVAMGLLFGILAVVGLTAGWRVVRWRRGYKRRGMGGGIGKG